MKTGNETNRSQIELMQELLDKHPEMKQRAEIAAKKRALGRELWKHFEQSGLTKAELARRMETSVAAVNRLFTAASHGSCTATTLFKFELATNAKLFVPEACSECPKVRKLQGIC